MLGIQKKQHNQLNRVVVALIFFSYQIMLREFAFSMLLVYQGETNLNAFLLPF